MKTTKEIANYVGKTYKFGHDIKLAVYTLEMPVFVEPTDPPDNASKSKLKIWEKKIDEYVRRESYFDENVKTLYSLVWGQCTKVIRAQIEALLGHKKMFDKGNSIELLLSIKAIVYNYQSQKYLPVALHENMKCFYLIYQDRTMTCQGYLQKFQNSVDVLQHCGAAVSNMPGLINQILDEQSLDFDAATKLQIATTLRKAQERYLAIAFFIGADKHRYGKLLENMENDFTQGQDCYPRTVVATYHTLTTYKQEA
jgi:hypothetical protein